MHESSANFSGWFRLKGKSPKMFNIIVPTKFVFFLTSICGRGAAARKAPPPLVGAPLRVSTDRPKIKIFRP